MEKGLLTQLGEVIDRYKTERQSRQRLQSTDANAPLPQRFTRILSLFLPNFGTLILVAALLMVNNAGALSLFVPNTATQSTGTIAYQGRLADSGGSPITATVNMIFRLYGAASGGSPLWEEQWTGSNSVQVSDGLFNVMLGSLTPIPQSVIISNSNLFLGITVGTDSEMSPRVQLGSVPFATQALTVPDGSITTEKLADGAVTKGKASGFLTTTGGNLMVQYGKRDAVTGTTTVVTFPKPFTGEPTVVATADTVGGQAITVAYIGTNSFTAYLPNTGGNVAINWIAIGPGN